MTRCARPGKTSARWPRTAARRMQRADDDGNLIPLGYARSTRSIAERRITSEAPDTKASVGS